MAAKSKARHSAKAPRRSARHKTGVKQASREKPRPTAVRAKPAPVPSKHAFLAGAKQPKPAVFGLFGQKVPAEKAPQKPSTPSRLEAKPAFFGFLERKAQPAPKQKPAPAKPVVEQKQPVAGHGHGMFANEAEKRKAEEGLLGLVGKLVKLKGAYLVTFNELSRESGVNADFLRKHRDILERQLAGDYIVDELGLRKAYKGKAVTLVTQREIKTPFDDLTTLVDDAVRISVKDAAKDLGKDPKTIEKWARILETRKLVQIEYSPAGGMFLRRVEEVPEEQEAV